GGGGRGSGGRQGGPGGGGGLGRRGGSRGGVGRGRGNLLARFGWRGWRRGDALPQRRDRAIRVRKPLFQLDEARFDRLPAIARVHGDEDRHDGNQQREDFHASPLNPY